MKILIIQQKMIGDVLTSSILFEVLRKEFPNSELHFLINSHTIPVVTNNPFIDKIIAFTPEIEKSRFLFQRLRKQIFKTKYFMVIDVYSKLSSAWISVSSRAKYRLSYFKWYTSILYTHTYRKKRKSKTGLGLAIDNRLLLLQSVLPIDNLKPKPKVFLTKKEINDAQILIKEKQINTTKKLYMIGALGSENKKTYPLKYLAKLLDIIVLEKECTLILNYMPSQITQIKNLINLCKKKTKEAIRLDIYSKDLRSFLALTSQCDAVIANEGGVINMAKALDIPTFSIFSPWILKSAWNSFESNGKNKSIHLSDFFPEIYKKHPKFYKNKSIELYEKFTPDLIIPSIKEFIKNN